MNCMDCKNRRLFSSTFVLKVHDIRRPTNDTDKSAWHKFRWPQITCRADKSAFTVTDFSMSLFVSATCRLTNRTDTRDIGRHMSQWEHANAMFNNVRSKTAEFTTISLLSNRKLTKRKKKSGGPCRHIVWQVGRVYRTSCRRAAATICPCPSPLWAPKRLAPPSRPQRSSSFPRPIRSHAHRCSVNTAVSKAAWWHWPMTFDLESGVRVTCDVGYLCACQF